MTGTIKDILRVRRHLINLIIMTALWIVSSFDYYLLNFQTKHIQGNIFLNTFSSSISEILSTILSGLMYKRLGVKTTFVFWFTNAFLGGLCYVIFGSSYESLIPVFLLFAKGGVTGTFTISYLANAQIFPAIIAGTAFGICNFGAKTATILSPMVAEVDPPVPMILFCVTTCLGGLLSLLIRKDPSRGRAKSREEKT